MQKVYLAWTRAIHRITEKKPLRLMALFFVLLAPVVASISIYAGSAGAAANNTINFQARILSNSGALVSDGFYTVEFNIYALSAGGATQWTETQVLTSKNGYLTANLGSVNPFGTNIDWSQEQWLSMNINADGEMSPRMKITAVPLALRAGQADVLTTPTGTISSSQLAQLAPGLVQSVTSTNTALRINQAGSGGLLQLQSAGSDVLTLSNTGDLAISKGLTVGNSTNAVAGTIRWNGTAFEGYNGFTWAPLGSSGGAGSLVNIVKPANETVNNSAALQNDDNLTFPIGANEEYTFRFVIQANSGATPDLRFAVTAPAGATCRVSFSDPEGATSAGQYGCGVSTAVLPGNGAVDLYEITGSVTNGATPGAVTLQWAQFTANASNTIVYSGSYVQAVRSIGAGSSGQVFVQDGNAFGETAVLGTSDTNALAVVTNGIERLSVTSAGNVGIGDTTPAALFTVGTNDALQINAAGNLLTSGTLSVGGLTTLGNNLVASGSATATTGTTNGTGTNTTTVTMATDAFSVNDVVFIDNTGQDYYTRITADPGTGSYTVSPAVSFGNNRPVTKYTVQNIGATSSDYSSQANRFFQGYFLGGLVVGAGSTTISDGSINSTTILRLQEDGGDVSIGGALNVTGAISGDASGLTNINASQISSGALSDSNLSANVTLLGNTFNGANQLLQLNGAGEVADSLLSINITKLGNSFNGISQLVQLDASGNLPSLNAAALTDLNASTITTGTVSDTRLSSNVTLLGNTFNGANQLLQLNGSGALPVLDASGLTSINADNISSGTLNDSRLSTNVTIAGNTFNGANQLLQLDTNGFVSNTLLTNSVTLAGNTFNSVSGLVQLDGSGALPSLNGAAITALNASSISTGTLSDSRLSSNVTLLGNTFNGANQLLQLNGSGAIPAVDGSGLTSLTATNISAGTLADARLSGNVGLVNVSRTYSSGQTFAANITLGTDSIGPTAGILTLNDAVGSNGFTSVLGTNNLTANRTINLPDANGTICLVGSSLCGFIALAPAAAQTDATTNNSLYINKTGASGDILTLQKNGTSILRMLNSGALQLQLTDVAAFSVKNGSGTDYFNVDTSGGLVRVGGATADATGVLLVLDTKNTAGDPTGVNGASYYNSVSGKSRCYENNLWQDCISDINKNKPSDQTITASAALTNDTALNYAMASNASYAIDATINFSTTASNAGFRYTFTVPTGATVYLSAQADTAVTTQTICNITASAQVCSLTTIANNFRGNIRIKGIVTTGATAGNVQFQFAQDTLRNGQSVTVYKGSILSATRTDQ